MKLAPNTPGEWVRLAVLGVIAFALGLLANVPVGQWLGVAAMVVGLVGWWVTAQIAARRPKSESGSAAPR